MDKLLSVRELAQKLDVSETQMYKLTSRERIPYIRVGNTKKSPLRFELSEVVDALKGKRPKRKVGW